MAKKVLTQIFSEPLGFVTNAKVDISTNSGNLTVDGLTGGEPVLASGTLQYLENQEPPTRSLTTTNGLAAFTVKTANVKQQWLRLPWSACNGATEWQLHLNPSVPSDITAHSGGGNIRLDLAGMAVTRIAADSGGGNMAVVLPDGVVSLNVMVKTGAGNVTIEVGSLAGISTIDASSGAGDVNMSLPAGTAARIQATSGMGKVILDPRFIKIDAKTYQSADYEEAVDRIQITLKSGAGNVTVKERVPSLEMATIGW